MKFIHIGYPKNLSTTLQRNFFSAHKDIYHLGVGINSNIDYVDDSLNCLFENYFIYSSRFKFNEISHLYKAKIEEHHKLAQSQGKVLGASAELLSFKFSPDHVDTIDKAHRLFEIYGEGTKIIMIIRNQKDLLLSLYKEYVKIGYTETYRDFINYCYYFKDRNFINDFCYDKIVGLYDKLFGRENVYVLPIEKFRDVSTGELLKNEESEIDLVRELCDKLNLGKQKISLSHYNAPFTDEELSTLLELNKKIPHSFGMPITNSVNAHRLAKYFSYDLNLPLDYRINEDVVNKQKKHLVLKRSENLLGKVSYFSDPYITSELFSLFKESNRILSERISLPNDYDKS